MTQKEARPMNRTVTRRDRPDRGQIIVIAALGMVVMIAFVAVLIEGGNAFAQQRVTQNAADAASDAGATVLAQKLGGANPTDGDVSNAVQTVATSNHLTSTQAWYTDVSGRFIDINGATVATTASAAQVGGGTLPPNAQGVYANGSRVFETTVGHAIGFNQLTSSADATAVTGLLTGGAFIPVVFPVQITDCDQSGSTVLDPNSPANVNNWILSQPGTPPAGPEYIVPLCKTNPGSFQILDFDPSLTCLEELVTPPAVSLQLPSDVPTDQGNNCAKPMTDYVNANLQGHVVLVPICDVNCAGGQGSGGVYHIIKVAGFYVDYMSDENNPNQPNAECQAINGVRSFLPGTDIDGNGSSSCLVGWFVRYITTGPVGAGPVGSADAIGIQLIK
jgi:Flp pilus assembly protein TadG